jgi:hypothetical protein
MDAGGPKASTDTVVLERVRLWIVGIIVLGLIGTMTELILLEHDEQALQFVPLVLMVLGAVTLAWYAAAKSTASLRALQIVMGLFVLSGFAGMVAHFNGSMEYQLELNPRQDLSRQGAAAAGTRHDDPDGAARPRLCVYRSPLQKE